MSNATAVNADTFDVEVINSPIPVMIDFWAEWCGPCKQIAPRVDEIATEYAGRVKVLKVDVDQEPLLSQRYGVMSIPMLLFFKDGQVKDQLVGAYPKQVIVERIEKLLG